MSALLPKDLRVDDLLISTTGKYPFKYHFMKGTKVCGAYLHNKSYASFWIGNVRRFDEVDKSPSEQKRKLFKLMTDNNEFIVGYKLGVSTTGNIIFERNDTGEVILCELDTIVQEIIPFTFDIKSVNGNTHTFSGNEKYFKISDLLTWSSSSKVYFGSVVAVNTKKNNTLRFKGQRLVAQEITETEVTETSV